MAEAPRKITIKLRPVGAKAAPAAAPAATPAPAAAPVEAPVAPAPAPAPAPVAAAPVETPATPEVTLEPVELTPIPETPAPEAAPAPAPAAPTPEEMAQQAKRQTSRIELPPEMKQPMNADTEAPTIKLKPISATAHEAPENPQAAKSKTARIELDAVLGGIQTNTPIANTTQKTIKLKRVAPAGGAKPTNSAPMSSVSPAAPAAGGSEAPTIKLQRPGLGLKKDAPKPAAAPAAEPELESLDSLEPLEDLGSLPDLTPTAAPESAGAKAFTIIAIIAAAASIIVTLIVCGILQKHAASPDGSPATGNTLHQLPFERIF